jgi:hypothetical protein
VLASAPGWFAISFRHNTMLLTVVAILVPPNENDIDLSLNPIGGCQFERSRWETIDNQLVTLNRQTSSQVAS